jgi:TolB-like protein
MSHFKRTISLFLLFCISTIPVFASEFDLKLDDLTQQITADIMPGKKTTIAVIPFSDLQGNVTQFEKYIAEELTTRLVKTKKFEVVERQLLDKILAEHKLNLTGLIETNSAKELGKLLGVSAIVCGTTTELEKTIKINARVIATETGSILTAATEEVTKNEDLKKLLANGKSSPVITPSPVLTPAPDEEKAGYQLLWDGKVVGYESKWTRKEAIKNLLWNIHQYPEKKVEGFYNGEKLPADDLEKKGYILLWDGQLVGYEPNWTRQQALENLLWNIQKYPNKKVEGFYNGEKLLDSN